MSAFCGIDGQLWHFADASQPQRSPAHFSPAVHRFVPMEGQ